MSLRRQALPFSRYSLSPLRYSTRVILTSGSSLARKPVLLSKVSSTCAALAGLREREPAKMISAMVLPRRFLGDNSPSTQRTASRMLLLPHPLGPTTVVMPGPKSNSVRSAKLLNPCSMIRLRNTIQNYHYLLLGQGPIHEPPLRPYTAHTTISCTSYKRIAQ